jgi:predicted metal-dependent HD superfamily phosphohydrolase
MINYEELSIQMQEYVTSLFKQYQTPIHIYHNLHHTKTVVLRANEIALNYALTETEPFIVAAAAWFHDVGHLFGPAAGHEERSVIAMRTYLKKQGLEPGILNSIEQCIFATKIPQKPKSLLEEIVCDADCYHFGTDEFDSTNELVKKEFELRNSFLPLNWNAATILLLEQHTYFTAFCRRLLQAGKRKNIYSLRKKLNPR